MGRSAGKGMLLWSAPWMLAVCVGAAVAQTTPQARLEFQLVPEKPPPQVVATLLEPKPATLLPPPVAATDRPLPINLATAMRLADVAPLDIAIATQRLEAAGAQLQRANTLWLPTIYLGGDYFRHDGQLQ